MKRLVSVLSVASIVSFLLVSLATAELNQTQLKLVGITNAADQATCAADPNAVVTLVLKQKNHRTLTLLGNLTQSLGPIRDETVDAVIKHLQNLAFPRDAAFLSALALVPPAQRAPFRADIEKSLAATAPTTPAWNSIQSAKILVGKTMADLSPDEMLTVMLAPEPLFADPNQLKTTLKTLAIPFARKSLRAEGKTFVVSTNGVNPLVAKLQPLVDALNAPYLTGIEAALRNLGMSVTDHDTDGLSVHDRAPLKTYAEKLQADVLAGDKQLNTGEQNKLIIALGVKGYNQFVDLYNKGAQ